MTSTFRYHSPPSPVSDMAIWICVGVAELKYFSMLVVEIKQYNSIIESKVSTERHPLRGQTTCQHATRIEEFKERHRVPDWHHVLEIPPDLRGQGLNRAIRYREHPRTSCWLVQHAEDEKCTMSASCQWWWSLANLGRLVKDLWRSSLGGYNSFRGTDDDEQHYVCPIDLIMDRHTTKRVNIFIVTPIYSACMHAPLKQKQWRPQLHKAPQLVSWTDQHLDAW